MIKIFGVFSIIGDNKLSIKQVNLITEFCEMMIFTAVITERKKGVLIDLSAVLESSTICD